MLGYGVRSNRANCVTQFTIIFFRETENLESFFEGEMKVTVEKTIVTNTSKIIKINT